jgi:DNA-binding winged helix-turn-helix (wHTH) protein
VYDLYVVNSRDGHFQFAPLSLTISEVLAESPGNVISHSDCAARSWLELGMHAETLHHVLLHLRHPGYDIEENCSEVDCERNVGNSNVLGNLITEY